LGYTFYTYREGRQPPDARPVYRFRSRSLNRYYFTADPGEVQKYTMDADWESKVAWYVPPEKAGESKGDQLHRQGLTADLYSVIKDQDRRPVRQYVLKSGPAVPGTTAQKPASAEPRAALKDASKNPVTTGTPKPDATQTGKPNAGPASTSTMTTTAGQSSAPAARTAPTADQVGVLTGLNDPAAQGLTEDLYQDVTGNAAVPVYHFTSIAPPGSMAPKQHFCTISEEEKHKLIDTQSSTWKYEGIAFFAYAEGSQPPGARPVYRFWSQRLNRYFFTMDESLKQALTDKFKDLWQYQAIAWYAPPVKPSNKK
jgi:hypothetical protein